MNDTKHMRPPYTLRGIGVNLFNNMDIAETAVLGSQCNTVRSQDGGGGVCTVTNVWRIS